jgi:hypothetical protein
MRTLCVIVSVACAMLVAACGSGSNAEREAEERAEYHMRQADSLESRNMLKEATLEYKLVAELYPHTSVHPTAVRNVALLYSNAANPIVEDSIALRWFQTYLTLPIAREEKVKAEVYVTMLKRITALQKETSRRLPSTDSLQTIIRRQAAELSSRTKRVQELEAELNQTKTELQRLREVDVRINRRKGSK